MFPIPFNFPFRKKDGSIVALSKAIEDGGSYTLPTASDTTKGGVKIGSGLTMDGETLNNSNPTPYSLPTASDEILGGVKVGSGLDIDENGVLSASGGGGGGFTLLKSIKSTDSDKTCVIPENTNEISIVAYRTGANTYHVERTLPFAAFESLIATGSGYDNRYTFADMTVKYFSSIIKEEYAVMSVSYLSSTRVLTAATFMQGTSAVDWTCDIYVK